MIDDMPLQDLPISPIDHIRSRLENAGYSVGEITGRLVIKAFGTVTYPDGSVPCDPDYQPPAA